MSDGYLQKLSSLKEDDFTKLILKPLFEAMGYQRVDFHGGPHERGRDLIAQIQIPPRREPRITYIQSKKIGDIQNVQDGVKLTTLLHQLRQCCNEKLKLIDATEAPADEVYLACPEKISSRLTEEIFSHLDMWRDKVRIYDGPLILDDIRKYKPSLLETLTSIKDKLLSNSAEDFCNVELLSALNKREQIDQRIFYSDLSFFVGSVDSNNLLHLEFDVSETELELSKLEWPQFKKEYDKFKKAYSIDLVDCDISDLEEVYRHDLVKYESLDNQNLIVEISNMQSRIVEEENHIKIAIDSLRKMNANDSISCEVDDSGQLRSHKLSSLINTISRSNSIADIEHVENVVSKSNLSGFLKSEISNQLNSKRNVITRQQSVQDMNKKLIPEPHYVVKFNKVGIEHRINSVRGHYIYSVRGINNRNMTLGQIRDFLFRTENDLRLVSEFIEGDLFCKKRIKIKLAKDHDDRVSISPHSILDTGFDIAVYGGAGVGKTTTLQVYAQNNSSKTVVYLPLNRVLGKLNGYAKNIGDPKFYKTDLVWKCILASKDIIPTSYNLNDAMNVMLNNFVLILDGLDEVYSSMPEIILGVEEFKNKNPQVQMVVSSRDCVSYLKNINFLGITLLPFTKGQLEKFIHGWLGSAEKSNRLLATINEYNLYEYIKTPLLATITCSLMEKGVKIPSNESAIYSERLNLLTGEYDKHKEISRQNQSGDLLRRCAISIAYNMQQDRARASNKADMLGYLIKDLVNHYTCEILESCFDELVDPCNVIVYDRLSNTYSFGHFRFQEHLVSMRLKSDRSIDIVSLTKFDWWRGSLGLYAQDSDFSYLFEDIYNKQGNLNKSYDTLEFMVKNAPVGKRAELAKLFQHYLDCDMMDSIFDDLNDYDDDFDTSTFSFR